MKEHMKRTVRPFGILFAIALIVAAVARIGLAVMDVTRTLAYDYISASGVPILEVVCSILTGSAFVAFLFAASLALMVSCAGAVLYAFLYERGKAGAARPAAAFLWGWATALVALVCLFAVVSGILSSVQVASMSSKLPGMAVLAVGLVVFAAFLGTLLGAASMTLVACVARARAGKGGLGANLVVAAAACGVVVMLLTVGTFSALNTAALDVAAVGMWFALDTVVNLGILVGASALAKQASRKADKADKAKA